MKEQKLVTTLPYLAFAVALVGLLGSLYFSEVMDFAPCTLCWYERIAMYPLVPILIVGILRNDRGWIFYSWPLIIFGLLVSIYHNLLYWKIIPEKLAPCQVGVSCTTEYIEWLGFITIPLLALVGFLVLAILIGIYHHSIRRST